MMDIKLEDSFDDEDLTIERGIFLQDETTTSVTEIDTYNKMSIKVEPLASEVHIQNKGQCFYKCLETNVMDDVTISNYGFQMDGKHKSIKEEPCISDAELPTEEYLECTSVGTEIKSDTLTENYFKGNIKLEFGTQTILSDVSSQNDIKCFTFDVIKKEAVNCINRDTETTTEPESENHSEAHLPDILQANDNEEGVLSKNIMVEDTPSSGSPRLNAEASQFNCQKSGFIKVFPNKGNRYSITYKSFHNDLRTIQEHKPHKCYICDLSYTQRRYLKKHKLIHEGQKPHKCDVCGKSFTELGNLKRHKLIHEGQRNHNCDICGKSFTELGNLKKHKLIHAGKRPHKCDVCEMSFTVLGGLKRHKFIHEGIRPHKCDVCGKSFTELGYFKNHKLIHEGKKPHKCVVCYKSFTILGNLKRHTLIHVGQKPHRCDVCEISFTAQWSLKRHKLIHEGKKPHQCDVCGKSFTWLRNLKEHKLIHEGKKPHQCDICNKSFIGLGKLKSHKLVHEGKQPHKYGL